jgi:putative SOS response-associated peptidase YedK
MCGRFVASTTPQALATLFDARLEDSAAVAHWQPSWNVAPTRFVPIVRASTGDGARTRRTDTFRSDRACVDR